MIETIAIIGSGKMGSALATAFYQNKLQQPPKRIIMTTRKKESLQKLADHFSTLDDVNGTETVFSNDNVELASQADMIILAVEPYLTVHVLEQIKDVIADKLLVSIIAGFTIDKLEKYASLCAIIMTSTLINYTKVPIAYTLNLSSAQYEKYLMQLLEPVGDMIEIGPGDLASTGSVLGCSTLFTLIYLDSVIKGGVSRGLSVEQSKKMILGVLKGTLIMLEKSGKSPDDVLNSLCTPGGTTIDGMLTLEEGGFRYTVAKLVQVSTDKAKILGGD